MAERLKSVGLLVAKLWMGCSEINRDSEIVDAALTDPFQEFRQVDAATAPGTLTSMQGFSTLDRIRSQFCTQSVEGEGELTLQPRQHWHLLCTRPPEARSSIRHTSHELRRCD
jgi:hypothetical protein